MQSLLAVWNKYVEKDVAVHALFDGILRHLPGTRVLSFFTEPHPLSADQELAYFTHDGAPYAHAFRRHLKRTAAREPAATLLPMVAGRTPASLRVYELIARSGKSDFRRLVHEEADIAAILERLRSFRDGEVLLAEVYERKLELRSSLPRRPTTGPSPHPELVEGLTESLRAVLDGAFAGTRVLNRYDGRRTDIPNMLAFVRMQSQAVRLVLSQKQRDWFLANWRHQPGIPATSPEAALSLLEQPLPKDATTVLTTAFVTGLVNYVQLHEDSKSPFRVTADSPNLTLRALHWLLTHGIASGQASVERALFYVPVHVSGSPWICLANAWPGNLADGWEHFHMLHSGVTPSIADKLRSSIRELYLRDVQRPLERFVREAHLFAAPPGVETINQAWEQLQGIYPFPRIELRPASTQDRRPLRLSTHEPVELWRLPDNPYFPKQFDYELLDRVEIVRACEHHIREVSKEVERERWALRDQLDLLIPHHLKQVLQRTVIGPIQQAIAGTRMGGGAAATKQLQRALRSSNACYENLRHWLFAAREILGVRDAQWRLQRIDAASVASLTAENLSAGHFLEYPALIPVLPEGFSVELAVSEDLFRIILNLLVTNAIEAMPAWYSKPEEQRLEIRFRRCTGAQARFCEVCVWNTGTFADESVQRDAGEHPIKRDEQFREEGPRGGLGLYILERILRLCGAELYPEQNRHFSIESSFSEVPAVPHTTSVTFLLPISLESL